MSITTLWLIRIIILFLVATGIQMFFGAWGLTAVAVIICILYFFSTDVGYV